MALRAAPSESISFLKWYKPDGPWVLTSIVPDAKANTRTFKPTQDVELRKWLESRAGAQNIYFHINDTGDQDLRSKASKDQVTQITHLHVDLDPPKDTQIDMLDTVRKRLLKSLKEYIVPPSFIIDSGNGYQGFWRLAEPFVPESKEDVEEIESYNRQIEYDLGGDHCFNVDRIMRLPGTINVPNKKKRAAGRVECPATAVYMNADQYDLSSFVKAPMLDGGQRGDIARAEVNLSGNLPIISDVYTELEKWNVPDYIKMVIVQGIDPDNPTRYDSRSEATWGVVCELVRREVPDDIIASILLDQDFAISGHTRDQRNPMGYAVRQIQRGKENAVNPVLASLNDQYSFVVVGGRAKIRQQYRDDENDRDMIQELTLDTFRSLYANVPVVIGQDGKGNDLLQAAGTWWLKHPQRRTYKDIMFRPAGKVPKGVLNLWQGFSYEATAGQLHQRWLDHVYDNICSGIDEHFEYLIKWCARVFQRPDSQSEVAIVLRGKEGTGKNTFINSMGALMPRHYYESSSSNQFLGQFNYHLRDKVLVHANEAFFAGDKRHEAALKMLITEEFASIEQKGVDIVRMENYIHLVMSSNSEWVVPAGSESRRFFVLDVSDKRMRDEKYFSKVHQDLSNGGYNHLLRYLLDTDLANWSVRKFPLTEALVDQRIRTLPKLALWWMNCLDFGYIVDPNTEWHDTIKCEDVWQSYVGDMKDQSESYRSTQVEIGKFLKRVTPRYRRVRTQETNGKRYYAYMFPTLEECREKFIYEFGLQGHKWTSLEEMGQKRAAF